MVICHSKMGGFKSNLLNKLSSLAVFCLALIIPVAASAESSGRQIEEVIVTAERQEASIQDTSISITAFTAEMLDNFGIRNQEDLQNFIPATTIQPYDATVRGVGRNFRALGGDPGVATYMNGVYSEDPVKNPDAKLYSKLSYQDVLRDGLKVIDSSAISLCSENKIPIVVLNIFKEGNITRAICGEEIVTLIS